MSLHYLVKRIVAVWEAVGQRVIDAAIYVSGESVFLLVWKPNGDIFMSFCDICLNKSELVVVLHLAMLWQKCIGLVFWNTVNFVGFSVIHVSQGNVATYVRCGRMSTKRIIVNFLLSLSVKEFLKSVKISQSYCQSLGAWFFGRQCCECNNFKVIIVSLFLSCHIWMKIDKDIA